MVEKINHTRWNEVQGGAVAIAIGTSPACLTTEKAQKDIYLHSMGKFYVNKYIGYSNEYWK